MVNSQQINVLLIEDDATWLSIIEEEIVQNPRIQVVARATERHQAIHLALQLPQLDLIVADMMLTMNSLDGIEIARTVLPRRAVPMIILTSVSEQEVILDAFAAGAINYVSKRNVDQLTDTIVAIADGQNVIAPQTADILLQEFMRLKQEQAADLLTRSELEVLQLLEQQYTQDQVANQLYISSATVKKHVSNILKKLNVHSTKDAINTARHKGILHI